MGLPDWNCEKHWIVLFVPADSLDSMAHMTDIKSPIIIIGVMIIINWHNYNNIYKQGGSLRSPPAAPHLYFPSCRSSYIPAYML